VLLAALCATGIVSRIAYARETSTGIMGCARTHVKTTQVTPFLHLFFYLIWFCGLCMPLGYWESPLHATVKQPLPRLAQRRLCNIRTPQPS